MATQKAYVMLVFQVLNTLLLMRCLGAQRSDTESEEDREWDYRQISYQGRHFSLYTVDVRYHYWSRLYTSSSLQEGLAYLLCLFYLFVYMCIVDVTIGWCYSGAAGSLFVIKECINNPVYYSVKA